MDEARLKEIEGLAADLRPAIAELIAALRLAWRERDAARNNQFEQREHWRKESHDLLARRGLQPNDLQWKWRGETVGGKTPMQYDIQEVCEAIFDALIEQGGYPCWIGDGISCVEQIVRAQAQRADRAEAEVERWKNLAHTGFGAGEIAIKEHERVEHLQAEVERLKAQCLLAGVQGAKDGDEIAAIYKAERDTLQAMWNTLADAAKDVLHADRLHDRVPLSVLVKLEHAVYSEHHDTIAPARTELTRLRAVREAAEAARPVIESLAASHIGYWGQRDWDDEIETLSRALDAAQDPAR